jgi:hypothetical protein
MSYCSEEDLKENVNMFLRYRQNLCVVCCVKSGMTHSKTLAFISVFLVGITNYMREQTPLTCGFQFKWHITYVFFELCDIRAIKHKDKPQLTHILSCENSDATTDDVPYI